ncbi:MAG: MG2 domain-containing protein, partial [Thermoanaerobaculia bacterium]
LSVSHAQPRPDVRALLAASGKGERSVHYAAEKTAAAAAAAYGYTTKVHIATDRPLYRPEQTVHFRALLRKVVEGRLQSSEGDKVAAAVVNPLGVILYEESLTANEYGAVAGSLELTDEPPLGEYSIRIQYQGQGFEGRFKIEEYRKPEFEVGLRAERPAYLRGEELRGKIAARYLFGGPVPRARVAWRVFEGPYGFDASRFEEHRWFFQGGDRKERPAARFKLVGEGAGETDAAGELWWSFKPAPDGRDHTYRVQLEATDLSRVTVAGAEDVPVTAQEIYPIARADRKVYRPGDPVRVSFRTVDARGLPLDAKGEVVLARRVRGEAGVAFDREVEKKPLDSAGGRAEAVLSPRE